MSSSTLPIVLAAGQPKSMSNAMGNFAGKSKPALSLRIPTVDNSQPRVSLDLGSPFCGNDLAKTFHIHSPFSEQRLSLIPRPPGLYSTSYNDPDCDGSESETQQGLDQYIYIPSTSPFYNPPSPPRSLFPLDCLSMSCEALSEPGTFHIARSFHEELDRILPSMDEKALGFDVDCLEGVDEQLLSAPMEVFGDIFYNNMVQCPSSPVPLPITPSISVSSFDSDCKQLPIILDDGEAPDGNDSCSDSDESCHWSSCSEASQSR
ncbi:hypothetical protein K435DRAFT_450467 [Dendrothele bispora CBS 962.96]|uniref:Uncharacterized protein n=1 Tax=Dendrothele bispora (strain CBS 962.96) TaxID=1314807 RepID=A0A4S8MW31_DENBC|nr:hypothetical protein K435DRAFT_450467 [Dendrothele bispora CBS 962.96]